MVPRDYLVSTHLQLLLLGCDNKSMGVENIVSLFHVVDDIFQLYYLSKNTYYLHRMTCFSYHSLWNTDLPEFQQRLYRLLRIGAAIGKSIGNFEDGFGGEKKYEVFLTLKP